MDIVYSIVFGIVQGLTEFLPVSSSGHLVVLHDFFNFELKSSLGFDVFLHLGTLVALVGFFYKDIVKYIKAFFNSFESLNLKKINNNTDQKISWLLIIGTIPAAVAGLFIEDIIEMYFRHSWLVAGMLIIVALLFFIVEKYSKKIKKMGELNWINVVIIGIAQMFALIPGVSRSGITIVAGMSQKLERKQAARFSFLLSIPVVLGAGIKKTIDLIIEGFIANEVILYILGFLFAAVIGYFCIKYFLKYLEKHTLLPFAWYRLALAVIIMLFII